MKLHKKIKDLTVLDLIALSIVLIKTLHPGLDLSEFKKLLEDSWQ